MKEIIINTLCSLRARYQSSEQLAEINHHKGQQSLKQPIPKEFRCRITHILESDNIEEWESERERREHDVWNLRRERAG